MTNLKVGKVTPTRDYIWVQLWFDRPIDDGQDGTPSLSGKLKYCEVGGNNELKDCQEKTTIYVGQDGGKYGISQLKGETKYYFQITLKNRLNQYGASEEIYYTTPSYSKSDNRLRLPLITPQLNIFHFYPGNDSFSLHRPLLRQRQKKNTNNFHDTRHENYLTWVIGNFVLRMNTSFYYLLFPNL